MMSGKKIIVIILAVAVLTSFYTSYNYLNIKKVDTAQEIDVEIPEEEKPDLTEGFKEYKTGLECYMAALEQKKSLKNYEVITTGTVLANTLGINVKQELKSTQTYYNDGSVLSEDITLSKSSFSDSLSIQTYYIPSSSQIFVRETKKVEENLTAVYTNELKETTVDNYKSYYGVLPNENTYNISSKTLQKEIEFNFDGNTYKFKLKFRANAPSYSYKKKIKQMADTSGFPEFLSCEHEITIDKSGKILSNLISEEYTIEKGILTISIKNNMQITYKYYDNELVYSLT